MRYFVFLNSNNFVYKTEISETGIEGATEVTADDFNKISIGSRLFDGNWIMPFITEHKFDIKAYMTGFALASQ